MPEKCRHVVCWARFAIILQFVFRYVCQFAIIPFVLVVSRLVYSAYKNVPDWRVFLSFLAVFCRFSYQNLFSK